MDWTNKEKYPGLYSLKGTLKKRKGFKLPDRTSPQNTVPQSIDVPEHIMPESQLSPSTIPARKGLSWGGKTFAGKMKTDQFVSLAGALSHALAPDTPQGRAGAVLSRFGSLSEERRLGKEEKLRLEDVEKRKLFTKSLLDVGREGRKRTFERGQEERERTFGRGEEARGYLFKEDTAETLAGTRMAEIERQQRGATRRAEIAAEGKGKLTPHQTETLALKKEKRKREIGLERFESGAKAAFTKYLTPIKDELGADTEETGLPPEINQLYLDANSLAQQGKYKEADDFIKKGVAEYEAERAETERIMNMPEEERKRYIEMRRKQLIRERDRIGGGASGTF